MQTRLEQNRSTIRKDDPMLKKLAVALVAASGCAPPGLARTAAPQTAVGKPAVTATTKIAAPAKPAKHIKKNRHTGKQVRNVRHGKVAHVNAKGRTAHRAT